MLVVGVDGGATKTSAVVIKINDGTRLVVGRGVSGSSNRNSVGNEAAVAAMNDVISAALKESGNNVEDVVYTVLALSGCDTDADVQYWKAEGLKIMPKATVIVENDAVAALCSGTGGELSGIVVISGTGSIGFGATPGGAQRFRAGGWGPLLGDAGNGHSIGAAALAAVARAADQRGAATPLEGLVLRQLGLASAEGLLGWAYAGDAPDRSWDRVAALAPLVFQAAAESACPVCIGILERAGEDLCELAETVARRLAAGGPGEPAVALVLAGSICADPDTPLGRAVARRLGRTLPNAAVRRPTMPPCEAAAHLAAATAAAAAAAPPAPA